jgi:hypothetical protein
VTDEIERTEALLKLARRYHLQELDWQEEGLRISIRREATPIGDGGYPCDIWGCKGHNRWYSCERRSG